MKKIIKRIFFALLGVLLLIIINFFDRNILDDIYISASCGGLEFNNVKEGKRMDSQDSDFILYKFFHMSFDKKYLQDEYEGISIVYDGEFKPDIIKISGAIFIENENRLYVVAIYEYKTKTLRWQPLGIYTDGEKGPVMVREEKQVLAYLEESGITKEDIKEHQDYILKETVLKKWAKGNLRFPFHLMRGIKVVDDSWNFEE